MVDCIFEGEEQVNADRLCVGVGRSKLMVVRLCVCLRGRSELMAARQSVCLRGSSELMAGRLYD